MGRTAVLVVALAALVCVVNGQGANSFPSQHRAGSRLLAQAPSSSNVRDSTVPTAAGGQAVTNPMGRKLQGSVSGQPVGVCTNCGGRKLKEEDGKAETGKRKLQGATSGVATPTVLQSTEPIAQGRKLRQNCPNAYCGEGGEVRTGKRKLQDATTGVATPTVLQSTEPNAQGRKLQDATTGVATPTVLQSTEPNAQGRNLRQNCPNAYCGEGGVVRTGKRKLQDATTGVATPTVLQSTEPNAQGRRLQEFFDDGHGGGTQAGAVGTGRRLLRAFVEDLHDVVANFA